MGIFDFLKRKKNTNTESERRAILIKSGRITEGTIIDSEVMDNGEEVVYYYYSIHGVDFESSDALTEEQKLSPLKYAPGAKVSIRYDPKNHGNAVLV
jgi:hypothetical protein